MPTFVDPITGQLVEDYGVAPSEHSVAPPADLAALAADPVVRGPAMGETNTLPVAPPPAPVAPVAPVAPGESMSTRDKVGVSVEEQGFDPGRYAQVNAAMDAATNRKNPAIVREEMGMAAGNIAANTQANDIRMRGLDHEREAAAALGLARANEHAEYAAWQSKQADAEAGAVALAQAEIGQARAAWQEQIARTAAMQVDSDRLFKNAGAAGRVGFAAAAFAEGFLGAKGIKVRAIDQINRRIDLDINEQLQDIQNGRETTAQFKALYDSARLTAQDDATARLQLRGMYEAVVKNELAAKMASAQSQFEQAQYGKLMADMDAQMVVTNQAYMQQAHNAIEARKQFEQNIAIQRGHLANARARLDWEKEQADASKKAKALEEELKQMKDDNDHAIVATDAAGDYRVLGVLRGAHWGEASKIQKEANSAAEMSRDLYKIVEDAGNAGMFSGSGTLASMLDSPAAKAYKGRAYNAIAKYLKQTSGAQVTDDEFRRYFNTVLPVDADWKRGGAKEVLKQFAGDLLENTNKNLAGYFDYRPPEYLQQLRGGQPNDFGRTDQAGFGALDAPAPPETDVDRSVKTIATPNPAADNVLNQGPSSVFPNLRKENDSRWQEMTRLRDKAISGDQQAREALQAYARDDSFPPWLSNEAARMEKQVSDEVGSRVRAYEAWNRAVPSTEEPNRSYAPGRGPGSQK